MDKRFIIGVCTGMAILGIITYLTVPAEALYSIPPTQAFKFVNGTSSSINADNYTGTLFLTPGDNMTLTFYPANNTVRFSSADTGGSGGDNLGNHIATTTLDMSNQRIEDVLKIYLNSGGELYLDGGVDTFIEQGIDNRIDFTGNEGDIARISDGFIQFFAFSGENRLDLNRLTDASDGNVIGDFTLTGDNRAGTPKIWLRIRGVAADADSPSEDTRFQFNGIVNGVQDTLLFDFNAGSDAGYARFALPTRFEQDVEFENHDVIIGGNTGSNGQGVIVIYNDVAPTSNLGNGIQIYAEDVAASSELKVRDEAGNISVLSPHGCDFNIERKSSTDWFFCSENPYIGKGVAVSYYEMIRALEEATGKTILHEYTLDPSELRDWDADQLAFKQQQDILRQSAIDYQVQLSQIITKMKSEELDEDGKSLLLQYERELAEMIIPNVYTIKPQPTYFDMVEERK